MNGRMLAGLLGLCVLAGCTDDPTASPRESRQPTSVERSTPSRTGDSPVPATPTATVPLVLAVHATRPVADVPLAAARELMDRAARTGEPGGPGLSVRWSALGQLGRGRAEVLHATSSPGSAREVLDHVRSDDGTVAIVPADAVDATVRVLTVDGVHPLRDPIRYPLQTAAPAGPGEVTTVTLVGDVMLGRRVARASGNDPIRPLRRTAERLATAEITAGNLESTLSDDGVPTQGGDSFSADPQVVEGLHLAGFDVVSLANNHVGDYGRGALLDTLAELRRADLPYVGAGRDLAEARRPVVVARDGIRVGFLATDSIGETPAASSERPGTNRLDMPPRTGPLNQRQLDRVTADIAELDRLADVVVVLPHWGTQYTHVPETSQRRAARAFAEAGADLVVGGHPHWVQGWELIDDTLVVHSLGNFVFDMDFQTKTMQGVFVEIVLWGGDVKAVEPVPYVLSRSFVPRVVTGGEAADILADVWSTSRGPFATP